MRKLLVTDIDQGKRLDIYLSTQLKTSRSYVKFLIESGLALLNGKKEKPSTKVSSGDTISYDSIKKNKFVNTDMKVGVIARTANYVVYDKPVGLAVHPNDSFKPRKEPTLVDIIARDFPQAVKVGLDRLGIVHRLDKNTSGVIVVAFNKDFFDSIKKQFRAREVKKKYQALVSGVLVPERGIVKAPVIRSSSREGKMAISGGAAGKDAETLYEVNSVYSKDRSCYSLVNLFPKTGRTHQIRVHLSSIGHPIVGDRLYGYDKKDISHHLLHATNISFKDLNKKEVEYSAALPLEFKNYIKNLGSKS